MCEFDPPDVRNAARTGIWRFPTNFFIFCAKVVCCRRLLNVTKNSNNTRIFERKKMKHLILIPVCALVAISVLGNSSLGQVDETEIDKSGFEINFNGGTITEYVDLLRDKPNEYNEGKPGLSIVVTESAKEFRLPEIRVTTNMTGALGIMEGCSTENQNVVIESDPSGNVQMVRVESSEPTIVTVVNAQELLSMIDRKDLLDAIEMGLEMQGTISRVELKLHEATGLLFAKGTKSGTALVHELVNELSPRPRYQGRTGGGSILGGSLDQGRGLGSGVGGLISPKRAEKTKSDEKTDTEKRKSGGTR